MEVILAKGAGFCFGVKRAIRLAEEVLEGKEGPVYTLGPLIHNPQVIKGLEERGIRVIQGLDGVCKGVLILRSHGLSPRVQREAADKGLKIVDATCPQVKKVQHLAEKLEEEGYQVVIMGEADHPEVVSILECVGHAKVIESLESIDSLSGAKRIGLVAQTTQNLEHFRELCSLLIPRVEELRIYNTICKASVSRQRNSLELARRVDLMIVVGGYNSANTKRLAEICQRVVETHHIEKVDQIEWEWLKGKEKIGVTAGASTPISIIEEVLTRLRLHKAK